MATQIPARQLKTATVVALGTANSPGTADAVPRSDHVHDHGSQTTGTHHAAVTSSVNGFMSAADKVILDAMTSSVKLNCKLVITTNVTVAGGAPNTVDSNTLSVNNRILVVGQTTIGENGIYVVTTVGTGSDGTWTKSTDTDTFAKIQTGNLIFVWGGNVYAGTLWAFSSQPLGNVSAKMVGGPLAASSPLAIGSSTAGTSMAAARGDHVHAHGSQASVSSYHAVAVASGNNGFMSGTDKSKLDGIASGADVTLTALAAAASDVSVNSKKLTNVADPTAAQDAATKAYVDALANGFDVKASVRCASPSAVSYNPNSTAPNTVDGVSLAIGDRVLVKDHAGTANGIWVVGTVGTGANGVWSRALDADTSAKVTAGMFTFVSEGTVNADTGWVLTNDGLVNLVVTTLTFAKFSSFALATATPPDLAATAAVGTSSKAAREDHVHAHGNMATSASLYHALAVAGGNPGFLSGADKTKLDSLAASQAATLGYVTVDVLLETPNSPAYASSLTLDSSLKNDFQIGTLTGNLAITISNGADGRQGSFWVKQDGTGSRTVSVAVTGRTVLKDLSIPDTNPQAGPNTITRYNYAMYTLGGTAYAEISKQFLA